MTTSSEDRLLTGLGHTTDRTWLWHWLGWALFGLMLLVWAATLTAWHFKDQIQEAAFLSDTRRDLLQAMQQVGHSLQTLSKEQQTQGQRLQALESARPKTD